MLIRLNWRTLAAVALRPLLFVLIWLVFFIRHPAFALIAFGLVMLVFAAADWLRVRDEEKLRELKARREHG